MTQAPAGSMEGTAPTSKTPLPADETPAQPYEYIHDITDSKVTENATLGHSHRFRFKSHKRRRGHDSKYDDLDDHHRHYHHRNSSNSHKRRKHRSDSPNSSSNFSHSNHERSSRHRSHHNRRHHHHREISHSPTRSSTTPPPPPNTHNPHRSRSLTPTTAFRESLFDALADDEGAAFWEGVYGQPVHTYPRPSTDDDNDPNAPPGDRIHAMTDDEYADYVRAKMWEKSHEAVLEERERRRKNAERKKQEEKKRRREAEIFAGLMDKSLKTGVERREKKMWAEAWTRYTKCWEILAAPQNGTGEAKTALSIQIPWPTQSGRSEDTTPSAIEDFFKHAPPGGNSNSSNTSSTITSQTEKSFRELLKKERIRWHPDKMQQILDRTHAHGHGGDATEDTAKSGESLRRSARLDSRTLARVTAVFQVVDEMWAKLGAAGS